VATVDDAAVRNTQDVDILLRRSDLASARAALESDGFVYHHSVGLDVFLDVPAAKARDAVHIIFANEKVKPAEPVDNPDGAASEYMGSFRVIALPALVQIKLTAFLDIDRVHLRDLLGVGLIDATWVARYPYPLNERLQILIDTPDG
jgi:hypothetical protein